MPEAAARRVVEAIARQLPVLALAAAEALLPRAGLDRVEQFHAGFAFRGWVAATADR